MRLGVVFAAMMLTACASAQEHTQEHTWRAALAQLQACGAITDPTVIQQLAKGLDGRWAQPSLYKRSIGPDYVAQLEADASLCQKAAKRPLAKTDSSWIHTPLPAAPAAVHATDLLAEVMQDLRLKLDDCRANGLGRTIPVSVRTLRNGHQEGGWEVYYLWTPGAKLNAQEMRFPKLSSPSSAELPPGPYAFRARKAINGHMVETEQVPMVVALHQQITFDIVLP